MVVVHAPYMLNVASTNNRIRIPGRKLLAEHAAGGRGDRRPRAWSCTAATCSPRTTPPSASTTGARPSPTRRRTAASRSRCSSRTPPAAATPWRATSTPIAPALGGDRRVRRRLRARHLPRLGGRLGPRHRRRRRPRDHRPDRPRAPEQQPRPARLQPRPARAAGRAARSRLELLVEVARAADCPVVLETPGDAAAHAEEIQLLRAALPDRDRSRGPGPQLTGSWLTVDAEPRTPSDQAT